MYPVRRRTLEGALRSVVAEIGASSFHLVRNEHLLSARVDVWIDRGRNGCWLPRFSSEVRVGFSRVRVVWLDGVALGPS